MASSTTFANYSTGFMIGKRTQLAGPDEKIWNETPFSLILKLIYNPPDECRIGGSRFQT
jgi:hypothetical protein